MTRLPYYALALVAALTASSGAYASTHQHNLTVTPGARASAAATAGAYASVASDQDIRKQCSDDARKLWGTNSQDMQTPRDFAFRGCMFDHGIRNP